MIRFANVIVYNYAYVIDPKVSTLVSRDIEKESILVFDEAHNIDNVCIESLSVNMNRRKLDAAVSNCLALSRSIDKCKQQNKEQLDREYNRLLQGLQGAGALAGVPLTDQLTGSAGAPSGFAAELEQLIPGDIRQAEAFVSLMRRVLQHLKKRLTSGDEKVEEIDNPTFVRQMQKDVQLQDPKALKFCAQRLKSLLYTLEVVDVDSYNPLTIVADFCSLIATYPQESPDRSNLPDVRHTVGRSHGLKQI